ncbi:hypothetical protein KCP77_19385 [Salmonella enterica subsp. enterica]|nr:hypothetical protein KCP77_19385 [Salmonella enterica subsp. enterica]
MRRREHIWKLCGSLRLRDVALFRRVAEVLCLAPPSHSPASIWLNAAILLLQQGQKAIYGADVCRSQQCATLFYPRRSRLAIAGWRSESVLNLLLLHAPAGRVIPSHAGNTGASTDGRNAGADFYVAGELRLISRRVATTPLAVVLAQRCACKSRRHR